MKKVSVLIINCAIIIFSLCAAAMAIEGVMRLAHVKVPRYVGFDEYQDVNLLYQPHQKARWCGQLGAVMDYDNIVETNGLALHDADHTVEKPKGVYRILFLGDSYVEAFQVPLKDTFFKILETNINKTADNPFNGKKVEVIAIGRSGAGSVQEMKDLNKIGLSYQPDMIISELLVQNDFKDDLFALAREKTQPDPRKNLVDQLAKITQMRKQFDEDKRWIFLKGSVLNRMLAFLISELSRKAEIDRRNQKIYSEDLAIYEEIPDPMFTESRKAWQNAVGITLSNHLRMKQTADAFGARYVVFFPDDNLAYQPQAQREMYRLYPGLKGKMNFKRPREIAQRFFDRMGIAHLDMNTGFERAYRNHEAPLHYRHDGHWNTRGHQLAADLLEKDIYTLLRKDV